MSKVWLCVAALGACWVAGRALAVEAPYDLIIANGHIVDGTGSPWYAGDVGIRDGRIAAIGKLGSARATRRIDAAGKVVAPGFIDMLGQSEFTILVDPRLPSKIYQGITTEITGEGTSAAPLMGAARSEAAQSLEHYGLKADWQSLGEYFARLERQGIGINLASYVGATTVREVVIGTENRPPSAAELARMRALVREAMEQGAVGVSTSLEYSPAPYAGTDELIALAAEAAPFGGIYATHMRSEGDGMVAALEETFRIAREAHISTEIWHLKVAGKKNWGHMADVIKRIEAARAGGLDISADTYAYTAWFNDMSAFVPPWAHEGGNEKMVARLKDPVTRARVRKDIETPSEAWDNEWDEVSGPESILIGVVKNPALRSLQGQTIAAIAKARGKDAIDTLLDILVEDNGFTGCAVFGMQEDDVALALVQPWVSINNDSSGTSPEGVLGEEHPHPRAYGTFPRILRKYVREDHRLTLEDAIRKFSALPAAHAAHRSWRPEARPMGRRGGVRSGDDRGPFDFQFSQ
jgi:N-acyl-D-amino-acid deacylase